MAVSGKELASLNFANLIGGPLHAIVDAQGKASITTANFIKQVGFDKDGEVITSKFSITQTNEEGRKQDSKLSVPFISLLTIPYIKIEEATVEFKAKLTSDTASSSKCTSDVDVEGNYWFKSAKIKSKTSYQKTASNSDKKERSFDMHVKVNVSNTDMPIGSEKILNMLEDNKHERSNTALPQEFLIAVTSEKVAGETDTHTYKIEAADISMLKSGDKTLYYLKEDISEIKNSNTQKNSISFTAQILDIIKGL
jgi:hypothetical protein